MHGDLEAAVAVKFDLAVVAELKPGDPPTLLVGYSVQAADEANLEQMNERLVDLPAEFVVAGLANGAARQLDVSMATEASWDDVLDARLTTRSQTEQARVSGEISVGVHARSLIDAPA
jgi:hypothetical protein